MSKEKIIKKLSDTRIWFYSLCLLILLYKVINHVSFTGLYGAPVFYPSVDNTYWLFLTLQFPQAISQSWYLSLLLDFLLIVLPVFCLIYRNTGFFPFLFTVVLVIYFLYYNSVAFHHYHGLISLVLLSIPFWFTNEEKRMLLWKACRYYFLFAFSSAAIWKLSRDGIYYSDQMLNILKDQHATYLFYQSESLIGSWYLFLLNHPLLCQILLWTACLIEFVFITGFFTARFDKYLLYLFLVFIVFNYIVNGINSHEFAVFAICLIPFRDKNQAE